MRNFLSLFSYSHARDFLVKLGLESLVKLNEKYLPAWLGKGLNGFIALIGSIAIIFVLLAVIFSVLILFYPALQPFFAWWGWNTLASRDFMMNFLGEEGIVSTIAWLSILIVSLFWIRQNGYRRKLIQLQTDFADLSKDIQDKQNYLLQRLDNLHAGILGKMSSSGVPEKESQNKDSTLKS